jgi:predicted transcriptional regulator
MKKTKAGEGAAPGEPVTSLTGLEAEVMGAVWDLGRPVHSMEVSEALLYSRRGRGLEPVPFQTVSTTLRRLAEKGVLRVVGRPGGPGPMSGQAARTPHYEATAGREEMAARMLDNASRTLLGRSLAALIPRLTGSAGEGELGAGDRDRLQRLVDALEAAGAADPDGASDPGDAGGGPGDATAP